jgi:hypothetical protein
VILLGPPSHVSQFVSSAYERNFYNSGEYLCACTLNAGWDWAPALHSRLSRRYAICTDFAFYFKVLNMSILSTSRGHHTYSVTTVCILSTSRGHHTYSVTTMCILNTSRGHHTYSVTTMCILNTSRGYHTYSVTTTCILGHSRGHHRVLCNYYV